MVNRGKYCFLMCLFVIACGKCQPLFAQTDSTKTLEGINVYEKRISAPHVSATPLQIIDNSHLEQIPALQLSDVVKHFSGVTIKDYGGVGGMKTVSVRGLGANHTLIAYDGVAVSDYQTGQINLSRFSLDNVQSLSLSSGNENDIFLPAKSFSSASVLNLYTNKPAFDSAKIVNAKIAFRGGSFLLLNPSVLLENKIGKRVSTSLHAEYLYNKGEYPYRIINGNDTINGKRKNTDIQTFRAEANCFVDFSPKHFLSAKILYYHSQQGLPGAVILYSSPSNQRMWDENVFAQIHYRYNISKKINYQIYGKLNYNYLRYLDPDYLNEQRKLDNKYWQREYYVSNSVLYKPLNIFYLSLANDFFVNNLNTSLIDFQNPVRYNSLTVLSAMYDREPVNFSATLLHTFVADRTSIKENNHEYNRFTPTLSLAVKPIKKEDWYVRLFYKNIFRLPTFNDLYYRLVGNINLKPEETHQLNIGFSWLKYLHKQVPYFSLSADVYRNWVSNKIIAIPNKNLFVWSMINLGKTHITGVDARLAFDVKAHQHIDLSFMLNYSYQHAIDMTDSLSKTYKHQIPYVPRHSGTGLFSVSTKWINVSYTLIFVGDRYTLGQNIEENKLNYYFDHSLALYHTFNMKKTSLTLRGEILNLANKHYEVVAYYPIPGIQFQGKIILNI